VSLGVCLRDHLPMTTDLSRDVQDSLFASCPALKLIRMNCAPFKKPEDNPLDKKRPLICTNPKLCEFLSGRTPHVLVLAACVADTSVEFLRAAAMEWFKETEMEPTAVEKIASLCVALRKQFRGAEIERALLCSHSAFSNLRAELRANLTLCDGGSLLCTNKALPLSRVACALVVVAQQRTSDGRWTPLLEGCRDSVPRCVCPYDADAAKRALRETVVTVADHGAIINRLPPRLVPFSLGEGEEEEEREEEEIEKEEDDSPMFSEESGEEEPPSPQRTRGGWHPEIVMSSALFEGDETVPCARAVFVFDRARKKWTSEFKRLGWTFSADARARLMALSGEVRPISPEDATNLVQWCAAADRIRFTSASSATNNPTAAREKDMLEVLVNPPSPSPPTSLSTC
jgi:hypothetical protein